MLWVFAAVLTFINERPHTENGCAVVVAGGRGFQVCELEPLDEEED